MTPGPDPERTDSRPPLRILLAEDNDADAKIAQRAFGRASTPTVIRTVRDGQEALDDLYGRGPFIEPAARVRPDLVVLDLNMPRMDGFTVIETLKKDPAMRDIPIAVMTTSRASSDVLRAYQAGAVSYILKPADFGDFARAVNDFCSYWHTISLIPGRAA